jgi:large subunit ribosomal protein L25
MSLTIDCQNRVVTGHAVRKLRREGIMPAVVYGAKMEPLNIQLNLNAFVKIAKLSGKTQPITLDVEGKTFVVKIHQADLHPVRDTFRHIDFLIVK